MKKIKYLNSGFKKSGALPLLFLILSICGCTKLVEVDGPSTSLNSVNIYENDVTAISVLNGIYTNLSQAGVQFGGITSMSYLASLSSDELTLFSSSSQWTAYYTNTLSPQVAGSEFWTSIYQNIYVVNAALEGVSGSTKLTPVVKQQLIGEARFMRAFCFFYLVNLYGDIPLVLTTDYKINSAMSRTPKHLVWEQIIADLQEAQTLLSSEYLDGTLLKTSMEKVRPTKWAATALLARSYLYIEDWENAEIQASSILENSPFDLESLDNVFLINSKEAIWQLQPVFKGNNSSEATAFIIDSIYGLQNGSVYLSSKLINDFDPGDQRRINWVDSITLNGVTYLYPYKYKTVNLAQDPNYPVNEYSVLFRLSELYLIRAEARIHLFKIEDGIADLNVIRNRATSDVAGTLQLAQLPNILSQEDALQATLHERQIEFFSEWGHRWLDLKRTGNIDGVMTAAVPEKIGGTQWKSYQQWYPLPLYDLERNPALIQNDEY